MSQSNSPPNGRYYEGTALRAKEIAAQKAKKSKSRKLVKSVKGSAKPKGRMSSRQRREKELEDLQLWLAAKGLDIDDIPDSIKRSKALKEKIIEKEMIEIEEKKILSNLQAALASSGKFTPEQIAEFDDIESAGEALGILHSFINSKNSDNSMNSSARGAAAPKNHFDLQSMLNELDNIAKVKADKVDELSELLGGVKLGGRRTRVQRTRRGQRRGT